MPKGENQEEQEELLPVPERKHSKVYKWKVAALVITILSVIFLGVDIFLMVTIGNNQPRTINYTFAVDLIENLKETSITPKQFGNMLIALSKSNDEIWFQKGIKIDSWIPNPTDELTLSRIIDFFTTKVQNRLTLVQFTVNAEPLVVGVYTHIPFKVPQNWNDFLVTQNKNFFTFEIDDRQSSIVGGNSRTYLKMNASEQNLTNCKIIDLTQSDLVFLGAVDVTVKSQVVPNSPFLTLQDLGELNTVCFSSNSQTQQFYDVLREIVGNVEITAYSIDSIHTFQLSTGVEE